MGGRVTRGARGVRYLRAPSRRGRCGGHPVCDLAPTPGRREDTPGIVRTIRTQLRFLRTRLRTRTARRDETGDPFAVAARERALGVAGIRLDLRRGTRAGEWDDLLLRVHGDVRGRCAISPAPLH